MVRRHCGGNALTELSRAGRTVRGLLACVLDDLEPRGIGIKSLTQGIDTSADAGPMGKLLLTLFAVSPNWNVTS